MKFFDIGDVVITLKRGERGMSWHGPTASVHLLFILLAHKEGFHASSVNAMSNIVYLHTHRTFPKYSIILNESNNYKH